MGIDAATAELLISGMKIGLKPGRALTLGRQQVFCTPRRLKGLIAKYGIAAEAPVSDGATSFAEDLFAALGFSSCESLDASSWEGASIVHDLNTPVPGHLVEAFDLVLDGGTLEHVFNFPSAIKNAMEMTSVGGALLIHACMNNLSGHGFYQFSPELFFRVLSPENGFGVVRMFAVEGENRAYAVADPKKAGGRVMLINARSTSLLVHAERTSRAEIFSVVPQQSDYAGDWEEARRSDPPGARDSPLKRALRKRLRPEQIARISRVLNVLRQRRALRNVLREASLSNRKLYTPVSNWALRG